MVSLIYWNRIRLEKNNDSLFYNHGYFQNKICFMLGIAIFSDKRKKLGFLIYFTLHGINILLMKFFTNQIKE